MIERIAAAGWQNQLGHVDRYRMAAGLLRDGDVVLDAACGVGYGAAVLSENHSIEYHGVDRADCVDAQFAGLGSFVAHDLDLWEPTFEYDVAVCFETLEHLADPLRFVAVLKRARRAIAVSVPTVPTKHFNEHHLHDFTVDQISGWLSGYGDLVVYPQPSELSHIFIVTK